MSKLQIKLTKFLFEENYFVIIPLAITFLLYAVSLTYGFRNFDEDILIKNFYVHKTFSEYIEKFFLIHFGGASEASGFSFSGISNVHVSILGVPLFYIISFLFNARPFLFHLWSLVLHLLALYFFSKLCFNLTQNKQIALFSGLIWTVHPTNVEPIIWATNWAHCLGAIFYFYTLSKIVNCINKGLINKTLTLFITIITALQILFTEHTITIPIAIFFTTIFYLKHLNKNNAFKIAFKISAPSFLIIFGYWFLRSIVASKVIHSSSNITDLIERVIFFSPQIFVHQLKLVLLPVKLSIDQIDLITLSIDYWGGYHILCIIYSVFYLLFLWLIRKRSLYLSYGLLLYLVTLLPFLQIIPLYSISGERYNYFGSAFIALGIASASFEILKWIKIRNLFVIISLIVFCTNLGIKSLHRINDWKDSKSLFLSTINNSHSLFKKGIWTYNLAISQKDKEEREKLLKLSNNLLELYIKNPCSTDENPLYIKYEMDNKSSQAKAALRIATNYEILADKDMQLQYLLKALEFSRQNSKSKIQGLAYKDLGTYYFQNNDILKALDYYNKSNFISPNPATDYAIAVCYLKLNNFSNYEKFLKKAVSIISPYNISPFKTYGQFLELSKNDPDGAARYYKIATILENNVEPYILLSSLYLKQHQVDNAFKSVKRGLYGFPKDPTLLYFHGIIFLNKGNKEKGIQDLLQVIRLENCPEDIKTESNNIINSLMIR